MRRSRETGTRFDVKAAAALFPSGHYLLIRRNLRVAQWIVAAWIACLAGCSSLPNVLSGEAPNSGFEIQGRASIRHGEEAFTANVQWRHQPAGDDLLITNSIGQGVARIERNGDEVTLETADARRFQARDAESLTGQVLGWRLPLSGLADWVRGRAAPGRIAQTDRDAEGRLTLLEQDDWRIEYQEYREGRPARMRLSRPNLEIRLIVDSWREAVGP